VTGKKKPHYVGLNFDHYLVSAFKMEMQQSKYNSTKTQSRRKASARQIHRAMQREISTINNTRLNFRPTNQSQNIFLRTMEQYLNT